MMGWQWHQLDNNMQIICTSLQTDNHASTSTLSFYRPDALPAAQPTASNAHMQARTTTSPSKGKRPGVAKWELLQHGMLDATLTT